MSLNRKLQVIHRAGGGREMPDVIHRAVEEEEFRHVLLDEFEIPTAPQVGDVVHAAGDEIINADDAMPAREQQVGEMGRQESGRAGDDGGWLFCFQGCHNESLIRWWNSVGQEPGHVTL